MLLEGSHLRKYFGDRLILDIEDLKVYSEDRIGVVGVNGAGKTTLVNILSQRLEPDEGWVKINGKSSYVSQLDAPEQKVLEQATASRFGVVPQWSETMSGGEKTRFKLAQSFERESRMIFADEPTSNLDLAGIELLESQFARYRGALVLISHDRSFLDRLCNKILEVEHGKVKLYEGNYSDYYRQKAQERERAAFEYRQYVREKKRLEGVVADTRQKSKSVRKTPRRMGNSEARLHKMGDQKARASLDRAQESTKTRIEQLEVKERPLGQEKIKFDLGAAGKLYSKVIIEGEGLNKKFGEKVIFADAGFRIENGAKVALIGPNGSGKTTLLRMIMTGAGHAPDGSALKVTPGARIGYFSQDISNLDDSRTILANVMAGSIYPEAFVRTLLARLLFKGADVYKQVGALSGGERVKVSLAKILLQDFNLLILDEPTNYMDIDSLAVMEEALQDYNRTLLFVSHDRSFIRAVADHIMTIEDHKIRMFAGNYEEYLADRDLTGRDKNEGKSSHSNGNEGELSLNNDDAENTQMLVLQNRLTKVVGKISLPSPRDDLSALEKEYRQILDEMKKLKKL